MTQQKEFRVAIAGCGGIAQVHSLALGSIPGVKVVACADIIIERAQQMAERHQARAYDSVEAMLAEEEIDCMHICTPHPLHTPLAKLAAQKGVHVFTERPPVVSHAQWEEFAALEKYGVRVGICFQNRYNACVQRMKELIDSGAAGKVKGARAFVTWQRLAPYYADSPWRGFCPRGFAVSRVSRVSLLV